MSNFSKHFTKFLPTSFLILIVVAISTLLGTQTTLADTPTYTITNLQSTSCPFGNLDAVSPMNLTTRGENIRIVGEGFGNRNVDDGINESLYIPNPSTGGLYQVYKGTGSIDGINDQPFGLQSWSDSEIAFEVRSDLTNLGNSVILRTYSSTDDNQGTCQIATLSLEETIEESEASCDTTNISSVSTEFSGTPAMIGDGDIVTINGSNFGSMTEHDSNNGQATEIHFVSPDGTINRNVAPISLGPAPNFTPVTPNPIVNFSSNQIQFEMNLSIFSEQELEKFTNGGEIQVWKPVYDNGNFNTSIDCGQDSSAASFTLTRFSSQACIYTYSDWSTCSPDDTQTRTIVSSYPNDCTSTPDLSQSCTYTAPTCTSWDYSDWNICTEEGTQSRTVTNSYPENCTGGNPNLSQSCTAEATCTEDTWSCSEWDTCTEDTQNRTCELVSDCPLVETPSPEESQSCTAEATCTEDTWTCEEWSVCSADSTQIRTCEITAECASVDTPSPSTTQSCTPNPTITSISSSPIYQGTKVTINGYGFGTYGTYGSYCDTCKVLVNNKPATLPYNSSYYHDWSNTSITFNMPNDATSGSIKVVDKNGATSNTFDFVVSTNPLDIPPTINSISPQTITPGDTITIKGNNFGDTQGYSKLATGEFVANGSVKSWSDTEIQYQTSSYYDTTSKKLGIQKCKDYYNCLDPVYGGYFYIQPQITSIDREEGPVGMTVGINGNYFKKENVISDSSTSYYIEVYFGGIEGQITKWANGRLEAVVPAEAKDGIVTVKIGSDGTSDYVSATGPYFDVWEQLSNDEYSALQTYFKQVNVPKAWSISGERRRIIVAVIDDGVYSNHPDFQTNMWSNKNEIKGNGKDDDANGYIDDSYGWDFFYNTADVTPTGNHGTQVAGIIGADSNNGIGIAGVNWNVDIMPLIVFDENGDSVGWKGISDAIKYATDNGAEVINLSLSTSSIIGFSTSIDEAIKYAYDRNVLMVVAAGNGDQFGQGYNLNQTPQSPVCNDGNKNMVIGVGAVDSNNNPTSWSNYGTKCVDIWAPGTKIVSTSIPAYSTLGEFYDINEGTSFSAPIVTGIVSLLKAKYPTMTSKEAIELLTSSTNNGVIDAYETIIASKDFVPTTNNTTINNENNIGGTKINTNTSINFSDSSNPFKDLAPTHRNKNAIIYLYKEKIIGGYPDGTFKPENDVNRAELLKILVEGKGISPSSNTFKNCFPDVKTDWYAPYVCYAKEQGWIAGYPDGTFKPANTVNKVEALKMLLEVFTIELVKPSTKPFDDVELSEWYVRYVATAKKRGILEEVGSIFSPGSFMKRSGISENIYRLLTL